MMTFLYNTIASVTVDNFKEKRVYKIILNVGISIYLLHTFNNH